MWVLRRLVQAVAVAILCTTGTDSLQSHGQHSRRSALDARISPETLGAGAALVARDSFEAGVPDSIESVESEEEEIEEDSAINLATTARPVLIFPNQTKCDKVRDEDHAYTLALVGADTDQPRIEKIANECDPESDMFWAKALKLGHAHTEDEEQNMCKKPTKEQPLSLATFCYGLFRHCSAAQPIAAKLLLEMGENRKKWWSELRKLEKHRCGGGKFAIEEEEEEGAQNDEEEEEEADGYVAKPGAGAVPATSEAEEEEEEPAKPGPKAKPEAGQTTETPATKK